MAQAPHANRHVFRSQQPPLARSSRKVFFSPRPCSPSLCSWYLLASLCLASPSVPLRADSPSAPKLLPDKTVLYVRVGDAQELVARFQETSLGRLAQDEQLKPLVKNLYGTAAQAFLELQEEVGLSLDEILQLPQGEMCLALVAPERGRPAVAGLFDCGDELPAALILIDRVLRQMRQNGWVESRETVGETELTVMRRGERRRAVVFEKESYLVLTSNVDLAKQLVQVWDGKAEEDLKTLADNRRFTAIMKRSVGTKGEPPQISWFVDPVALVQASSRGNVGLQTALTLLSPLGLNGLEGVGGSIVLAPAEFDSIMHLHVLLGTPRVGVLNLLALQSGDLTPEPWVPGDVASSTTLHWDLRQTYQEAADVVDVVRGEGQFAQLLQQRIGTPLGVNVEKDLLAAAAGRFTLCTRIQRPITLNSETRLFAIQLQDPAAFETTLEKMLQVLPESPVRVSSGGVNFWAMNETQRNRVQNRQQDSPIPVRTPDFAIGILDDYLILSNSRKFFEKAVVTRQGGEPPLAEQLEYQRISGEVERQAGRRKASGFVLRRPEESLRGLYDFAQQEQTRNALAAQAQSSGFFRALDEGLRKHPLPPFEVLAKYLAPQGGLIFNDETGIHYTVFALRRD